MPPLPIWQQIAIDLYSRLLRFLTPKGFLDPSHDEVLWIKRFDFDEQEETYHIKLEIPKVHLEIWMAANARKCQDELIDIKTAKERNEAIGG